MSTYLLMALLLVAAVGLALAPHWAEYPARHRMHWYSVLALVLAFSALEFFLLSSQLALLMPAVALLGLPLPLLLGPLWWRADSRHLRWSMRRWMVVLFPASLLLSLCVLGLVLVGIDDLATAGALPAQALVFASVLSALLSRPKAPRKVVTNVGRHWVYAGH